MNEPLPKLAGVLTRLDGTIVAWDRAAGEAWTSVVQMKQFPDGTMIVLRQLTVLPGGKRG